MFASTGLECYDHDIFMDREYRHSKATVYLIRKVADSGVGYHYNALAFKDDKKKKKNCPKKKGR